ncbi:hypothetical protein Tco_0871788 [Tanacetum coccineum]
MEALQAQEDLMKSIENFLKKFNRISFGKTPKVLLQAWDNFFEAKHVNQRSARVLANFEILPYVTSHFPEEDIQKRIYHFLYSSLYLDEELLRLSLLYDNLLLRPPGALSKPNSNAIASLPHLIFPVADNDSLMEEIDLFLDDEGSIHQHAVDILEEQVKDCVVISTRYQRGGVQTKTSLLLGI